MNFRWRAAILILPVLAWMTGCSAHASHSAPAASGAASTGATARLTPRQQQAIDDAARQTLASLGAPSASVAVVTDDRIAYVHAYGLARLDPQTPAAPAMRYAVGSISKQFTATAMMMLAQAGKLRLDDPVGKYLPGVTDGQHTTLRELLSHTSGYEDYWPQDYVMPSMMRPTTAQAVIRKWARRPLDFPPGTRWQYSNTNFVMAGWIVQKVSGKPLMQFLQERLFTPLHLGTVGTSIGDMNRHPATAATVQGYVRHALGPLRPAPVTGAGWLFGAGELALTARQLAQWDVGMLEQKLLQPASYREMETAVRLKDGKPTGYGLGLEVGRWRGHRYFGHSGEVSGFTADEIAFPGDRDAVVVLTNAMANDTASVLAHKIAAIVLGVPGASAPGPSSSPARKPPHQHAASPAAEPASMPGGSRALAQARAIFTGLQNGRIDRQLLTPDANAYFDAATLNDYASSLAPLGKPVSFTLAASGSRGGMQYRLYHAGFPDRRLTISTYTLPNGKLEQYMVMPASN